MTHAAPIRLRPARAAILVLACLAAGRAGADTPPMTPDIPAKFVTPTTHYDYEKRTVDIPMRDGVTLHTVIVVPKGARRAPIMLTRTPYNAEKAASRSESPYRAAILPVGDDVFVEAGYIRVYQDVRGKYGSKGDYVVNRPLRGPLNGTRVDHSTDAWDTIDWLVKHVPESNGRVGMTGSSYPGFTTLMGLVDPHPALKVAVPMCPMVDGWRGDDWFHNGAFRQGFIDWLHGQLSARGEGKAIARIARDDYEFFRRAGSVMDAARIYGLTQLPMITKIGEHPAYDPYWQEQAVDRLLAKRPLTVPVMIVAAQWDQEDIYGAHALYAALEPQDTANDKVFLVMGPWRHSGQNAADRTLGPLRFDGDPAREFRHEVMRPFLDRYLRDDAPPAKTPPVVVYETGTQAWREYDAWPRSCAQGCPSASRPLYLTGEFGLAFTPPPATAAAAYDEFVSDPAKPVPNVARPVRFDDADQWRPWLLSDQRHAADRTDVLTYVTEPLTNPVRIGGAPVVNLFASTSGTDSDWVVKLIDVYPDVVPERPELGGYQLGIAMDIFRGRYRDSLSDPSPIPANEVQRYRFALPNASHVFEPGHRIMVQIQSSWFPLYDRNPQTYVDNIFFAKPGDYRKATQRVHRHGEYASFIELPVAP
ncbi:MAG: CocE/NonD family hydrolase [Steroidobacteraceae bacterium]